MAVLKNKTKRENYLVVSKIFLQDEQLSLAERGLLATLHSFPDEWDFTIRGTAKILPDGEYKIGQALNGLIAKGYVSKTQSKENGGKFGRNEIEIYERPSPKKPSPNFSVTANPVAGKPITENLRQYNNKKYNNKELNTNQSIKLSIESDEIEAYRKIIAENIKLDWLLNDAARHMYHEDETRIVNEIYDVICDIVCFPRKLIYIKGTGYPWEVVKSRFLKLNYEHVGEVLNIIIDDSLEIKNMTAYLISTLYDRSLSGTLKTYADMADDYIQDGRGKPYNQ